MTEEIGMRDEFRIIAPAPTKSILRFHPETAYHLSTERPNWWWRLWQYLLLGWKWEKVRRTLNASVGEPIKGREDNGINYDDPM